VGESQTDAPQREREREKDRKHRKRKRQRERREEKEKERERERERQRELLPPRNVVTIISFRLSLTINQLTHHREWRAAPVAPSTPASY
jgi:hypothetical protein